MPFTFIDWLDRDFPQSRVSSSPSLHFSLQQQLDLFTCSHLPVARPNQPTTVQHPAFPPDSRHGSGFISQLLPALEGKSQSRTVSVDRRILRCRVAAAPRAGKNSSSTRSFSTLQHSLIPWVLSRETGCDDQARVQRCHYTSLRGCSPRLEQRLLVSCVSPPFPAVDNARSGSSLSCAEESPTEGCRSLTPFPTADPSFFALPVDCSPPRPRLCRPTSSPLPALPRRHRSEVRKLLDSFCAD